MNILGIHAAYTSRSHDPSACLIQNGKVIAAIEEERLNRIKTSTSLFPERAIRACIAMANISIHEIDVVVADGSTYPPLKDKINRSLVDSFGYSPPIELTHHAYAHCAGSFVSSGFDEALVVSVDGVGDQVATLICTAKKLGSSVEYKELYRGDITTSLGVYYSVFTNYLGFRSIEGEYKVMGMAAYGSSKHDLSNLLEFNPATGELVCKNNQFIDLENYTSVFEPSYKEKFIESLTGVRRPVYFSNGFQQEHFDLAASVQFQFQKTYLDLISYFLKKTGLKKLCLSGGCSLNCLANKELLGKPIDVYVMPAASDRGLSMGAAMYMASQTSQSVSPVQNMYLGRSFEPAEIKKSLDICGVSYTELSDPTIGCASAIAEGKVVGWFQGRSEFGPRALGHRSILANPQAAEMKDILNAKIKFRESYRPFAPAILESELNDSGLDNTHLPYMTFTVDVPSDLARKIPGAVHFDGTARVQSVSHDNSPLFAGLLDQVQHQNGFGAVINTSFNLAGEPIVDSPHDAIRTFYSSGIDTLYLGNFKLEKSCS
ncbi:MAG: hypothetical protein F6J87_01325 [Spirulina sp. SIO3F2]|nr:hypothetical protein [Spirulina sp. SIO3F2]